MTDIMTLLSTLRRPGLLLRAARVGAQVYVRSRDQYRATRDARLLSPSQAIMAVVSEEQEENEKRKTGDASYSVTRHIELLIALIAEAALLRDQA